MIVLFIPFYLAINYQQRGTEFDAALFKECLSWGAKLVFTGFHSFSLKCSVKHPSATDPSLPASP